MDYSRVSAIKKSRKESLLFREICTLFAQAQADDTRLNGFFISRVELSDDRGLCRVYFYSPEGQAAFTDYLAYLKLFKPSLRAALAARVPGRYVPDLIFCFDDKAEKQARIDAILDRIKHEEKPS